MDREMKECIEIDWKIIMANCELIDPVDRIEYRLKHKRLLSRTFHVPKTEIDKIVD